MKSNIRSAGQVVPHAQRCRFRGWGGLAWVFALQCILLLSSTDVYAQSATSISTLPYEIKAPGTYVLTGDLGLNATVSAISIQASNVTLDCGGHRITSTTRYPDVTAIAAVTGLSDVTVKNCTVINFDRGFIAGRGGYRTQIIDNQVLNGGTRGITIMGNDGLVSGNRVIGLRSKPGSFSEGISLLGFDTDVLSLGIRILDNMVADVVADQSARGIGVGLTSGAEIIGNTILDIRANPAHYYYSYYIYFPEYVTTGPTVENALVRQNVMMSRTLPGAYVTDRAYAGQADAAAVCQDNVSVGFRVIDYGTCQLPERNVDIE